MQGLMGAYGNMSSATMTQPTGFVSGMCKST